MAGFGERTVPAWDLESEHSGALLRLERLLQGRRGFTLVILEHSDSVYRDRVADYLEGALGGAPRVDASTVGGDFAELEERLARAACEGSAVQVVGLRDWPHGMPKLWQAFNYHREQVADRCSVPLLLWVLRGQVGELATQAPDFWAWRSGVFDFSNPPIAAPAAAALSEKRVDRGHASASDRERRIAEIDAYLAGRSAPKHTAELGLLLERGELLVDLGDLDRALESFQAAAVGCERNDDRRGEALVKSRIADVLFTRGDLDEALRIRREESLPVYEKLGDVRSRAIASWKHGLLLAQQGQKEEGRLFLCAALRDAEHLKIPDAERIRAHLKALDADKANKAG